MAGAGRIAGDPAGPHVISPVAKGDKRGDPGVGQRPQGQAADDLVRLLQSQFGEEY